MITRSSFQTFHLFPSLPPELQLHIWALAAEPSDGKSFASSFSWWISITSRTLSQTQRFYESIVKQDIRMGKRFGTRRAMMGTCAQSRREALKCWRNDIDELDVVGKVEIVQATKKDALKAIERLEKGIMTGSSRSGLDGTSKADLPCGFM